MTWVKNWDDFAMSAKELFLERPDETRCVMKYRHQKGYLEVKVTDDRVVRQFSVEND
jgi:hypothetical protein